MLTYDLKIAADILNTYLGTESAFTTALQRLKDWHAVLDSQLAKIAAGGQEIQQAAGVIHSHLASTGSTTQEVNVEEFFASSSELSNLLKDLFPATEQEPLDAIGLVTELAALRKFFSVFIARQTGNNALPLLKAASAFSNRLRIFQEDLNYFADSLASGVQQQEHEEKLSLVFHSSQTLHSFWAKLKAVEEMYAQLCELLEVDLGENQLRISKIESGSEWISLFGHAAVVGIIGKLIIDTFKFAQRNYTREGRIEGTKASTQQVDAIIATIVKLDKLKVDTNDLRSEVKTAAESIAVNLNDLLAHESTFVFGETVVGRDDGRFSLMRRIELKNSPPQLGNPSDADPA